MDYPRYHSTPPEVVAEVVHENVFIDDYTFRIDRPVDSDHIWVRSAYAADGYVPYWAQLWPSARMLAKVIVREEWEHHSQLSEQPLEVLEIGCGLGLAGIAALTRGLRVTFSDVDHTALRFAAANARLNGHNTFQTIPIDFRCPPTDRKYPVVIGSDLMYEERLVDPLVGLLRAVLTPNGICLITDPDRTPARIFRQKLTEAGYDVASEFVRAGEPGGGRTKGTLYRIRLQVK